MNITYNEINNIRESSGLGLKRVSRAVAFSICVRLYRDRNIVYNYNSVDFRGYIRNVCLCSEKESRLALRDAIKLGLIHKASGQYSKTGIVVSKFIKEKPKKGEGINFYRITKEEFRGKSLETIRFMLIAKPLELKMKHIESASGVSYRTSITSRGISLESRKAYNMFCNLQKKGVFNEKMKMKYEDGTIGLDVDFVVSTGKIKEMLGVSINTWYRVKCELESRDMLWTEPRYELVDNTLSPCKVRQKCVRADHDSNRGYFLNQWNQLIKRSENKYSICLSRKIGNDIVYDYPSVFYQFPKRFRKKSPVQSHSPESHHEIMKRLGITFDEYWENYL